MFLDIDRTPFNQRIFAIMDRDLSGHIDFFEFAVAMWNYCTLGEESLALFAFDIYDKDCNGIIEGSEVETMLSDLYGFAYPLNVKAMKLHSHLSKKPNLKFTPHSFRTFCKHNPALFFPAFEIQHKMQTRVIGKSFWAHHAAKRVLYAPKHKVLTVKDVLGLHTDEQALCDLIRDDPQLCKSPYARDVCSGEVTLNVGRLLDCCEETDPLRQCLGILDVTDVRNKRHEAAMRLGSKSSPSAESVEDSRARARRQTIFQDTQRLKRFEIGHDGKKRANSTSTTQSDDDDLSVASMSSVDARRENHRRNVSKWIMGFQNESEKNLLKENPRAEAEAEAEKDTGFNFHIPSLQDDIRNFVRRHIAWKTRIDLENSRNRSEHEKDRHPMTLHPLKTDAYEVSGGADPKKRGGRRFSYGGARTKVAPMDELSLEDHPIYGTAAKKSLIGQQARSKAAKNRRHSV